MSPLKFNSIFMLCRCVIVRENVTGTMSYLTSWTHAIDIRPWWPRYIHVLHQTLRRDIGHLVSRTILRISSYCLCHIRTNATQDKFCCKFCRYQNYITQIMHNALFQHISGWVQERRNSSAIAMELRLSCTISSICHRTQEFSHHAESLLAV